MRFLLLIALLLLFPMMVHGEPPQQATPVRVCPDNLRSALIGINNSITHRRWINIEPDACPHIQDEILKDVDKIIELNDIEKYLALMSSRTLRLVRNAFFARKGYIFSDPELKKHFVNYSWYKPKENADVQLSREDDHWVHVLKSVEDKWVYKFYKDDWDNAPTPILPRGVAIHDQDGRRLLILGEKAIDISRKIPGGGWREEFFTIRRNPSQDTVLVCSQHRSGDSRFLTALHLYSADGKLIFSLDNTGRQKDRWINGLFRCPDWSPQIPQLLISHNRGGMSGAVWDTFVTFDATLKPVTVLACEEPECISTNFFSDVNEGNVYLSAVSRGGVSIGVPGERKSTDKPVSYEGTGRSVPQGANVITWAIWVVEKNGKLEKVLEIEGSPIPISTLMAHSRAGSEEIPRGDIVSAIKLNKSLVLYRVERRYFGTTLIPLP